MNIYVTMRVPKHTYNIADCRFQFAAKTHDIALKTLRDDGIEDLVFVRDTTKPGEHKNGKMYVGFRGNKMLFYVVYPDKVIE